MPMVFGRWPAVAPTHSNSKETSPDQHGHGKQNAGLSGFVLKNAKPALAKRARATGQKGDSNDAALVETKCAAMS